MTRRRSKVVDGHARKEGHDKHSAEVSEGRLEVVTVGELQTVISFQIEPNTELPHLQNFSTAKILYFTVRGEKKL